MCKLTYWMKDYETQEWLEVPCVLEGRHGTHSADDGRGHHAGFSASAAQGSRARMEESERTSTARERRYTIAVETAKTHRECLAEEEAKIARRRELLAEAEAEVAANAPRVVFLDLACYDDARSREDHPMTNTTAPQTPYTVEYADQTAYTDAWLIRGGPAGSVMIMPSVKRITPAAKVGAMVEFLTHFEIFNAYALTDAQLIDAFDRYAMRAGTVTSTPFTIKETATGEDYRHGVDIITENSSRDVDPRHFHVWAR